MYWLALQPRSAPRTDGDAQGLLLQATAWLALQYSPRVARFEEAIVLEAEASLRLFGGPERLVERLHASAAQAGFELELSPWAGSALAALALLRSDSLTVDLDALPLDALSASALHRPMLERLGCRRLADIRRLPRAALARRFGPGLLRALDQAYGEMPEAHEWLELPENFEARLELPARVEHAPELHHHAQALLRQLCAWLAARHAGVQGFSLAWTYDAMRPRDTAASGALRLHTAEATRDFSHLSRLLGEHLARTTLEAPAGELMLKAERVIALHEHSESLLIDATSGKPKEALPLLLERLSVRLGPESVRCARLAEDHRLDLMQRWTAWPPPGKAPATRTPPGPQPAWLLDPPLRLAAQGEHPLHHGPLLRIAGPHRVEGGWWQGGQQRDYFVYFGAACGLLWTYRERLSVDEQGWFLHGVFA
jgi:protein ImuB